MAKLTIRVLICVALLILGVVMLTAGLGMTRVADTVTVVGGFLLGAFAIPVFLILSFQIGALFTDFKNLNTLKKNKNQ